MAKPELSDLFRLWRVVEDFFKQNHTDYYGKLRKDFEEYYTEADQRESIADFIKELNEVTKE